MKEDLIDLYKEIAIVSNKLSDTFGDTDLLHKCLEITGNLILDQYNIPTEADDNEYIWEKMIDFEDSKTNKNSLIKTLKGYGKS